MGYLFSQQIVPHFGKAALVPAIEPALASTATGAPAGGRAVLVSANVSQAGRVGLMSVPPSWATSSSAFNPVSSGTAASFVHGAPAGPTQGLIPAVPRDRRGAVFGRRRYGIRPTVMVRPPDAV